VAGLFGLLGMASQSLEAQTFGLDTTGQNIANANTAGYTRRVVDFASVPPSDPRLSAGGGVQVLDVRQVRYALLDRRFYQEQPLQSKAGAISDSLQVAQTAIGDAGKSIDAQLSAFFDSWSTLADNPTSSTARSQVVAQGQQLAASFRDMSSRLTTSAQDADSSVRSTVDSVNSLATQIASLNQKIQEAGVDGSLTLRDQQGQALQQLAQLTDIQTITNQDGTVQVSFAQGHALVVGQTAYQVTVSNAPTTGLAQVISGGDNVTTNVSGGKLAGYINVRDTLIPNYKTQLDTLAYAVATQVNTQHTAGFTAAGAAAPNFFQPLASATGAASQIAMNATVVADPSQVAAAGVAGTPGDNTNARAMANLRDAKVLAGNTQSFSDAWSSLVYTVGQDASSAKAESDSRGEVVRQIVNLQDSVSGVSIDEETANMMKFQRAYEANAKYFNVINSTLDVLMSLQTS
jgi:flagellar hook-associated protein 1 FlgK